MASVSQNGLQENLSGKIADTPGSQPPAEINKNRVPFSSSDIKIIFEFMDENGWLIYMKGILICKLIFKLKVDNVYFVFTMSFYE